MIGRSIVRVFSDGALGEHRLKGEGGRNLDSSKYRAVMEETSSEPVESQSTLSDKKIRATEILMFLIEEILGSFYTLQVTTFWI